MKGAVAALAAVGLALGALGTTPQRSQSASSKPQWLTQILYDQQNSTPWGLSTFKKFHVEGITGVEINLNWGAIEPTPGRFNWTTLRTYLHDCAVEHLKLIPIFWEQGYSGNPPLWLAGGSEVTSTGLPASEPAFWSHQAFNAYAAYVTKTVAALNAGAFGGAYIDYGWLDAGYGPHSSGIAGYAPQDVAEFHTYLAQKYQRIAVFNGVADTHYQSFNAVPAFTPGQRNYPVYERFRLWSYETLLGRLLADARRVTDKPLYIYWGGGISSVGSNGNLPDNVFGLAKKYHAVVNFDSASNPALDQVFGFLSQAYQVPLLEEWTPVPGTQSELAQWLGNYPSEGGNRDGEDYYLYGGTGGYQLRYNTYPSYVQWRKVLESVRGSQPRYRVGIMVGYDQVFHNTSGAGPRGGSGALASYLQTRRPAANVFTDLSVLHGVVRLQQFKTIVDWNGDLQAPGVNQTLVAKLKAFDAHGGTIIPGPSSADSFNSSSVVPDVPAAITSNPADLGSLELSLSVGHGRTWVVAANSGNSAYSGTIQIPECELPKEASKKESKQATQKENLLGHWMPHGAGAWHLALASGQIAVLQIPYQIQTQANN